MDAVGAELRKAREERHLTLAEISDVTLINTRFLEAIEHGNYSILPEAYIRAFIREYAAVVGVNPAEILRMYDEDSMHRDRPGRKSSASVVPIQATSPGGAPEKTSASMDRQALSPWLTKGVLVIVVGTVLGVILWNALPREHQSPTPEISFKSVVKDNEARVLPPERNAQKPSTSGATGRTDSLTLSAVASDTVWVQVFIDSSEPREYIIPPKRTVSWRAAQRFVLTVGNAGGIEFSLNGRKLGPLGRRGAVVRNVEFTHRTLSTH